MRVAKQNDHFQQIIYYFTYWLDDVKLFVSVFNYKLDTI